MGDSIPFSPGDAVYIQKAKYVEGMIPAVPQVIGAAAEQAVRVGPGIAARLLERFVHVLWPHIPAFQVCIEGLLKSKNFSVCNIEIGYHSVSSEVGTCGVASSSLRGYGLLFSSIFLDNLSILSGVIA